MREMQQDACGTNIQVRSSKKVQTVTKSIDGFVRFLLTMSIEDHTSQTFVQAFDEIGSQIFGTSANELMKLQNTDPDAYSRALADALFKTYNAKIRAKMETFNDNTRTRYQLIECSPISWVDEGREMANAIQKYF